MRLSLSLTNFSWPDAPESIGPRVGRISRIADQAGFDTVWVMDHLFQIGMNGPPEAEMLEGYTTLGYIAGQTERIQIGTLVTAVSYRSPGLLVKTVTTLDVLSGGRAWLGIGAAWNDEESRGLGLSFPPLAERFEQLDETLRIALQMWDGDDAPFHGVHHRLERPLNVPNSLRRPHPPIMVGGSGEKKTLRLVAQYADACNLFGDLDTVKHKLEVLAGHCADVGRPYEDIEKTVVAWFDPDAPPAQNLEQYAPFAEIGVDHVITAPKRPFEDEDVEKLGSLVPDLAKV